MPATLAHLAVFVALAALPTPPKFLYAPCETSRIEVGNPAFRWALAEGFHDDELEPGGRDTAWTKRESRVMIYLTRGRARTVRIHAHAVVAGIRVTARWNGHDLGSAAVPTNWSDLTFAVPVEWVVVGENVLRLSASDAPVVAGEERPLALRIDFITVDPQPSRCEPAGVELYPGLAQVPPLGAGAMLMTDITDPMGTLSLIGHGTDGPAEVDVFHTVAGDSELVGAVTLRASGRGEGALSLLECCEGGEWVSVVGRGPNELGVEALDVVRDDDFFAWRRLCGTLAPEIASALLALVLALAATRLRWLPFERFAPWLDVGLIVLVALAVRLAFLHEYPTYPMRDYRRFGDAWEYLHRARMLASGESALWSDTDWHAWQSWLRAPGYYAFLAAVSRGFASGINALGGVQAVLGAVVAGATYVMAYPLFGRVPALIAGGLCALYPESVMSAGWILTEPLYMALLIPAFALFSWVSVRPRAGLALIAGVVFGLACLVRPAPLPFVPLMAVLLVIAHRTRASCWAGLLLVVGMVATVAPWCVRNSMLRGYVMGIEDVSTSNFLQAHPDDRYVRHSDLDLTSKAGFEAYFRRLQVANEGGRLSRQRGIVAAGLRDMARDPLATARRFTRALGGYIAPFPSDYVKVYLGEDRPRPGLYLLDALNVFYVVLFAAGAVGAVLALRDVRAWALVAWPMFLAVVVNLVFYVDFQPGRFRLPSLPMWMVFAGVAACRLLAAAPVTDAPYCPWRRARHGK